MTKLVSMKLDKSQRETASMPTPMSDKDAPAYPWGLSLTLDDDILEKLEIDASDLTVGSSLTLLAKVEVTSISMNETKGAGAHQGVSLQITDMGLDDGPPVDAAKRLYRKE